MAPLLELSGVTIAFGDLPVVEALDLSIAPGESLDRQRLLG